ncbi:alkylated dna repair alkb [Fusarium albosuccineum]|uniref:mRNA N(6)-methyladenine demethylase n=1 Tax=Fusarium albosuccineum TaxID=1237068 RepID=A0A8H4P6E5_9HYPO|nr:alkylated dna repair alkb [Fusarium albosuccineum]
MTTTTTTNLTELDAHEQPSDEMRAEWKSFSRQDPKSLNSDPRIDDPQAPLEKSGFRIVTTLPREQIASSFTHLGHDLASEAAGDVQVIHHPLIPGLLILPSLLPPTVQKRLLDRLVHRDLSNPKHQTNLHLHYDLPYPQGQDDDGRSFFSLDPNSPASFTPKDPSVHKALSISQVLQRKLHWVTLGGQYDWTNRVYPNELPPRFPDDICRFLERMFPETDAQAAILNFYTPGDTMMMHRDVSEETDKGLISLSLGCEGLFMIAPNDSQSEPKTSASGEKPYLLLRLRSGDAIYMTQESRSAWHGVPKVLKDTCPSYLEGWPARDDGRFDGWTGWMKNKRINLNVRQMRD